MRVAHLSSLTLAFFLTSCASVDSQKAELATGKPCCQAVPTASVVAYVDKTFMLKISDGDPVMALSTGNSRTKFIDFGPEQGRPAKLFLRPVSPAVNVYTSGGSWSPIFFSAVSFFDSLWQPVGVTQRTSTGEFPPDCAAGSRCAIGAIAVTVPSQARYMAVHTPTDLVGQAQIVPLQGTVQGQTYMINGTFVTFPGGGQASARVIAMSVGEVEIRPLPDH